MKKIIYTCPDGGMAIVHPATDQRLVTPYVDGLRLGTIPFERLRPHWESGGTFEWAETEDEFIQRVIAHSVPPDAINVQVIDAAEIPGDRTFRNAWQQDGINISHNLVKAKAIAHAKRREDRAAEFALLDIEATIPATAAQAEAARGAVRLKYAAMQVAIDAATTPEALKALLQGGAG